MNYNLDAPKVKHNRELTGGIPKGFNPEMLPDPREGFMLGLVARRGSGKSFLIYNLLKKFYKGCFDQIYIFNPSYGNDMTLSPESLDLPEECFFDKIDPDFIQSVINKQVKQKKDYDNGDLRKKHLDRVLFVFDDCISDPNFCSNKNTNILNTLAFKGRHFRTSTIVAVQIYNGLSKRFRVNVPNFIFFKTENQKERKAIIEEQGSGANEKKFEELFDYATADEYDFFFVYGTCPNKQMKYRRNIDNILEYK